MRTQKEASLDATETSGTEKLNESSVNSSEQAAETMQKSIDTQYATSVFGDLYCPVDSGKDETTVTNTSDPPERNRLAAVRLHPWRWHLLRQLDELTTSEGIEVEAARESQRLLSEHFLEHLNESTTQMEGGPDRRGDRTGNAEYR